MEIGYKLVLFLLFCKLPFAFSISPVLCPVKSVKDSIFDIKIDVCEVHGGTHFPIGVIEVDEVLLQKAMHTVHKNEHDYVALLFYASWCPFSGSCRPNFSVLSSVFPSIPHFAVEESAVRPSILSKYGVHGFPTLLLLNSTMRVRYQGSRSLDSLVSFYSDVTGIETATANGVRLDKIGCPGHSENDGTDPQTCPFPWAKSPENLLQQETYLALATIFVILRLFFFAYPTLRRYAQLAWRRYIINRNWRSLWEHPSIHLNRVIHTLKTLIEPCRKSNLQEGAKNAKAWASTSLATVSFGDSSSSSREVL